MIIMRIKNYTWGGGRGGGTMRVKNVRICAQCHGKQRAWGKRNFVFYKKNTTTHTQVYI